MANSSQQRIPIQAGALEPEELEKAWRRVQEERPLIQVRELLRCVNYLVLALLSTGKSEKQAWWKVGQQKSKFHSFLSAVHHQFCEHGPHGKSTCKLELFAQISKFPSA
jgi:fructosamine-3-kinase